MTVKVDPRHRWDSCTLCGREFWMQTVFDAPVVCRPCESAAEPPPVETCDVCQRRPAVKVDYRNRLRCLECSAGVARGWVRKAVGTLGRKK